jgi:hypothetical protein
MSAATTWHYFSIAISAFEILLLVSVVPSRAETRTAEGASSPSWIGAENVGCQWHRRAFAHDPQQWQPEQGGGYGEDIHASYFHWGYPASLPEGTKIHIEGDFPHARYMNFQVSPPWHPEHRAWRGGRGAPLVPLIDEDIEPDPGHTNPFRPGADRTAPKRHYHVTFELRSGQAVALNPQAAVPPYRAPGNVRIGGHRSGRDGQYGPYIEFRMYAPDRFEPYGGVALPVVRIELPGQAPTLAPPIGDIYFRDNLDPAYWVTPYTWKQNPCGADGWSAKDREQSGKRRRFVENVLANIAPPYRVDPRAASRRLPNGDLLQLKAFGIAHYACTFSYPLAQARALCPKRDWDYFRRGPQAPPPGNDEHTNGWDMANSYIFSFASLKPGEVLVFQGRAPRTPKTLQGADTMPVSSQLRYWSLCLTAGSPAVTTLDCVMDEHVVRDASERYTIVISTAMDRPSNARRECGVTWLPWRAGGEAVHWRFKSTHAETWKHAPQRVSWAHGDYASGEFDEKALSGVMGEYLPHGRYVGKSTVEAWGCRPYNAKRRDDTR